MRFDWCKENLHTSCEEHKYDHCEMCNMARAYQHGYETAREDMSIDAIEVVRCKDCKHHEKFLFDDSKVLCWVHDTDIVVSPTDYCSFAERREESEVEE